MVGATANDDFVREHDAWTRGIAAGVARELGLLHAMDDLVGYAFAGLMEARARYTPGPVPFQGYAYYRVRGAVLNGAHRVRGLTRRALIAALQAADERLEECAQTPRAHDADRHERALVDLDGLIHAIVDAHALAMIADESSGEAAQIAAMDRTRVRRAVAALPERERIVLEGIYFEDQPLGDIGARLGLSRSWASRLHTRGLRLLRESLDDPETARTGGAHGAKRNIEPEHRRDTKKAAPASGTRKRGGPTIAELAAEFRAHAEGLEGADLEREIEMMKGHLIERQMRVVPEAARPALRRLLGTQLDADPTLRQLLADLRAGVKGRG